MPSEINGIDIYRIDKYFFNRIKRISYYLTQTKLEIASLVNLNSYIPKKLIFKLKDKKEVDLVTEIKTIEKILTEKEAVFNEVLQQILDKAKDYL